jgi:SAM-dependent methyltransferase
LTPGVAERLYLDEAFRLPPKGRGSPPPEAYSRAWFDLIEEQRYRRHGHWVSRVLEFTRHAGETLVGLGGGLGTDWRQYARHGASVIACTDSRDQHDLLERHFRLCEEAIRVCHAPLWALPIESASVDVVCLHGVIQEEERFRRIIDEAYRILRPGGKVIALVPAKYDAGYWQGVFFPWRRLFGQPASGSRLFTARGLKTDFARFVEHSVKKRHLRRSHLPQLWRLFPLPLLERIIGQWLILKAFKPLSAALSAPAAGAAA